SRRRHTRFSRDWSSDVCSSDLLSFGPITFLICVLGGLGNLIGGFFAAFIFAQFISVGGFVFQLEWGYVLAFLFFIVMMFWKPERSEERRVGRVEMRVEEMVEQS